MYKIRALFNGRVRYNTLILGILPLLFLLETVLSPLSGEPITGFAFSKIPIGFICLVLDFTGGTYFGFEWDLFTHSTITAVSTAVYFLLLALFILSCYFYLNDKINIYCKLSKFLYVTWALFILPVVLVIEGLSLPNSNYDLYRLLLGGLIVWSVLMILFLAVKCLKNTKMIKERIDNKNV